MVCTLCSKACGFNTVQIGTIQDGGFATGVLDSTRLTDHDEEVGSKPVGGPCAWETGKHLRPAIT